MGSAPRHRFRAWSTGLLFVSSAALAAQDGAAVTATGKHFMVEFRPGKMPDDVARLLADDALAAAEAAWPAIQKAVAVKLAAPPRLVIHADEAAYRAAERASSKAASLLDDFVLGDGTEAHLPLFVMAKEVVLATGLPENTRQTLQRCAVQAVVLQSSEAARQDPWLAELIGFGVAESLTNPKLADGVDPLFDWRRGWLAGQADDDRAGSLIRLVLDTEQTKDAAEARGQRNLSAVVAQAMAGASSSWPRKLLGKSTKTLGLLPYRLAVFEGVFGKDRDKMQAQWRATCKAVHPVWTCFGSVASRDGGLLLVGGTTLSWISQIASLPPSDYAVCGTFRIDPTGLGNVRIELDWDQSSLVGVWCRADEVAVERWLGKGDWEKPLFEGRAPVKLGTPFELRIEVGNPLRVRIGGNLVAEVPVPGRTWRGTWKVAANDSIVHIANLRVEPLPTAR